MGLDDQSSLIGSNDTDFRQPCFMYSIDDISMITFSVLQLQANWTDPRALDLTALAAPWSWGGGMQPVRD